MLDSFSLDCSSFALATEAASLLSTSALASRNSWSSLASAALRSFAAAVSARRASVSDSTSPPDFFSFLLCSAIFASSSAICASSCLILSLASAVSRSALLKAVSRRSARRFISPKRAANATRSASADLRAFSASSSALRSDASVSSRAFSVSSFDASTRASLASHASSSALKSLGGGSGEAVLPSGPSVGAFQPRCAAAAVAASASASAAATLASAISARVRASSSCSISAVSRARHDLNADDTSSSSSLTGGPTGGEAFD